MEDFQTFEKDKNGSTFTLTVQREPQVNGCLFRTSIQIAHVAADSIGSGQEKSYNLPREITKIKLYTQVPMGKDIVKELVVDPANKEKITVCFKYKTRWMDRIPLSCFFIQTSHIIITSLCYL